MLPKSTVSLRDGLLTIVLIGDPFYLHFAATTVSARTVNLDLGFLGDGEWKMTVYADDPERTPSDAKALSVSTRSVRKSGRESFAMCDEGGAVAVFEHVNL